MKPLVRLVVLVMLCVVFPGGPLAGPSSEEDLQTLRKEVSDVADTDADHYIQGRKTLDGKYRNDENARPLFRRLTDRSETWKVRLLALIVVERSERSKAVEEFLAWTPEAGVGSRIPLERIERIGSAIAEKGQSTPALLVEKLWKDNESLGWTLDLERPAYLACAIGKLKLKEARPLLEQALPVDSYSGPSSKYPTYLIRERVAWALGEIGDPASVPTLLGVLERDPNLKDSATEAAVRALSACATQSSIPFLQQKAEASESPNVRTVASSLLKKIQGKSDE